MINATDLQARVKALHEKGRTRDWDYHDALDDVLALLNEEATVSRSQEFWNWFEVGIDKEWISDPFCGIHNDTPYTEDERRQIEADNGDPDGVCITLVRVWETSRSRATVLT